MNFASHTNLECLPEKKGQSTSCGTRMDPDFKELVVGPRGGKYMLIGNPKSKKRLKVRINRNKKLEDLDYDKVTFLKAKKKGRKREVKSSTLKKNRKRSPRLKKSAEKSDRKSRFTRKMSPRKRRMMEKEILTGPRGGQYYFENGKKHYLTSFKDY